MECVWEVTRLCHVTMLACRKNIVIAATAIVVVAAAIVVVILIYSLSISNTPFQTHPHMSHPFKNVRQSVITSHLLMHPLMWMLLGG